MTTLFDHYDLAGLPLPNRVAMAPMTRVRSNAEGLATASMAAYYAQRASAGLIISEGIQPSLLGQSNPFTPGLYTEAQVDSWEQVTSAVRMNGGRIFAQLMHGGRVSHQDTTGLQPVGPSAVAAEGVMVFSPTGPQPAPLPRALTTAEAAEEALTYAAAARNALAAGFDGVELHGANGYLISQFLSSNANQRTDIYGGSIAGRIRFVVEAVAATVQAVGGSNVGIRLSPGGGIQGTVEDDATELNSALLSALAPLGLAYVHVAATTDEDTLVELRRVWPGTLIVNPSNPTSPEQSDRKAADHWLHLGADLISFGRAFLSNPDLVERLRADLPLDEADLDTFYAGGDTGYLTYAPYRYS